MKERWSSKWGRGKVEEACRKRRNGVRDALNEVVKAVNSGVSVEDVFVEATRRAGTGRGGQGFGRTF